jgi:serine acetyltransferase
MLIRGIFSSGKCILIGSNESILGGVKIVSESVFEDNALATNTFLENSIIVGNPAKLIKSRGVSK